MNRALIIYFIAMSIAGFATMGIDKKRARENKWRIPERTLFIVAILGGSIGSLIGMYTFRHKTKHMKFVIGIPVVIVIQAVAMKYFGII